MDSGRWYIERPHTEISNEAVSDEESIHSPFVKWSRRSPPNYQTRDPKSWQTATMSREGQQHKECRRHVDILSSLINYMLDAKQESWIIQDIFHGKFRFE